MPDDQTTNRTRLGFPILVAINIALGIILLPKWGIAQSAGDGFLFRTPKATLSIHGGVGFADAASDIFDFTTDQLTIQRRDFSGPALDVDLAIRMSARTAIGLGIGYSGASMNSEFRDWVDQDDLPIEQTTTFRRVPLRVGLRAYLTPPGREVGNLAWVPKRWAPYVGAGVGLIWYRFEQEGEFVDFESLDIFNDHFESSGWSSTLYTLAGIEFSLTPRVGLIAEGRYSWAEAELSNTFKNFDPIDLSGLTTTLGIRFRL